MKLKKKWDWLVPNSIIVTVVFENIKRVKQYI